MSKYKCKYCGKEYNQLWTLENHEKNCTYKNEKKWES